MRFTSRRFITLGAILMLIIVGVSTRWTSRGRGSRRVLNGDVAAAVATDPSPPPVSEPVVEEKPLAQRRKGEQPGKHDREVDRLFAELHVLKIEIDIPPEGVESLRGWHWRRGTSSRPEARAIVREGGHSYADVAVQLKGAAGSFRPIDDEPGLTLHFDKHAPEQRFHGLKKLSLNNSVQDPSFLSEKICREIFLAARVPAPRATHALVKLNGRDLGLYVLVEGFNKQFLKRHFKDTSGNLFDSGFVQDITEDLAVNSGDHPEDHSSLERLAQAAAEPDGDLRLKRMEEVLDVERFLAFTALEVILCHWDGYAMNRNNYRVFHDLESGRLIFLPHGLDQAFGGGRGSPSQPIFPHLRGIVAGALLQTPAGRQHYLETLTRLYHEAFDLDRILRRVDEVKEPIRAALAEAQSDRLQSFLYHVQSFKDAIRERARSIEAQLESSIHLDFPSDMGIVSLDGWRARTDTGNPGVVEEQGPEGRTCLVIRAGDAPTLASWRTARVLTPGRYRFEGRVRCADVIGKDGGIPGGACLRNDDWTSDRRLTGTQGWTAISQRFRVSRGGPAEVELICELRCDGGEAWFDKQSLRLVRE